MSDQPSDQPSSDRDEPSPTEPWRDQLVERARVWWRWIGPGRVLAGAGTLAVIGAIGLWLVRSPAMPTEARLPLASRPPAGAPTSAPPVAPTSTTVPPVVVVHVAGAVARPGIYELAAGARVADAISAAGGATAEADPDTLNLAAPLLDGDRVAVPIVGEAPTSPGGQTHAVTASSPLELGPLDLNTATVDDLDALPGVGPATAAAIVAHRDANGPFAAVDDLEAVRGIGPAKLESIRPLVTV